ncbi:MAG TPA: hypothetical protein PKY38_15115 [Opitutaceae bacterium]|nr:hypothetical protein [Opitutaceae bacterium]
MPGSTSLFANRLLKIAGWFNLAIAAGMLVLDAVLDRSNWTTISMVIAAGLVMIFAARAVPNDERIEQLKLKAAKAGLLLGLLGAMLANFYATLNGKPMPWSAFDLMIVILLIALGSYRYWRWQDARPHP